MPTQATDPVEIEDRYLTGCSLRLRHMRADDRDVYKLTQKVRPRTDDPSVVALTNIYLTADEHSRLSTMPAATLTKRRHRWLADGRDLAVDEMLGRWTGIVFAELEHDGTAARPAVPDAVEVTGDDRFSGGALAAASDAEVAALSDVVRRLLAS
ncbi:MAG TPA: hypothetical protein VFH66_04845 [Mycobacteriales bacterium]|nr:hypothetical protein [Mycobacteriales bacterium]